MDRLPRSPGYDRLCGNGFMTTISRRTLICTGAAIAIPPALSTLIAGCNRNDPEPARQPDSDADGTNLDTVESYPPDDGKPMNVKYLEIVTPNVEALCDQYSRVHGITFGDPDANLGGARTAELNGGGLVGIRGPMRETETPVIRPYMLVDDLESAVAAAADAGAEIAIPSMEIAGHGTIAIVIQGGIECGLWQS